MSTGVTNGCTETSKDSTDSTLFNIFSDDEKEYSNEELSICSNSSSDSPLYLKKKQVAAPKNTVKKHKEKQNKHVVSCDGSVLQEFQTPLSEKVPELLIWNKLFEQNNESAEILNFPEIDLNDDNCDNSGNSDPDNESTSLKNDEAWRDLFAHHRKLTLLGTETNNESYEKHQKKTFLKKKIKKVHEQKKNAKLELLTKDVESKEKEPADKEESEKLQEEETDTGYYSESDEEEFFFCSTEEKKLYEERQQDQLQELKQLHAIRKVQAIMLKKEQSKQILLRSLKFLCPFFPVWSSIENTQLSTSRPKLPKVGYPITIQRDFTYCNRPFRSIEAQHREALQRKISWSHEYAKAQRYVCYEKLHITKSKSFLESSEKRSKNLGRSKLLWKTQWKWLEQSCCSEADMFVLDREKTTFRLRQYFSELMKELDELVEPTAAELKEINILANQFPDSLSKWITKTSLICSDEKPSKNFLSEDVEKSSIQLIDDTFNEQPLTVSTVDYSSMNEKSLFYLHLKNEKNKSKNNCEPYNVKSSSVLLTGKSPNLPLQKSFENITGINITCSTASNNINSSFETVEMPSEFENVLTCTKENPIEVNSNDLGPSTAHSGSVIAEISENVDPITTNHGMLSSEEEKKSQRISPLNHTLEKQDVEFSDSYVTENNDLLLRHKMILTPDNSVNEISKNNITEKEKEKLFTISSLKNTTRVITAGKKKKSSEFIESYAEEGSSEEDSDQNFFQKVSKKGKKHKSKKDENEESEDEQENELLQKELNETLINDDMSAEKSFIWEPEVYTLHRSLMDEQDDIMYKKYFTLEGIKGKRASDNQLLTRRQMQRENEADYEDEKALYEANELEALIAEYREKCKNDSDYETSSSDTSDENDSVYKELSNSNNLSSREKTLHKKSKRRRNKIPETQIATNQKEQNNDILETIKTNSVEKNDLYIPEMFTTASNKISSEISLNHPAFAQRQNKQELFFEKTYDKSSLKVKKKRDLPNKSDSSEFNAYLPMAQSFQLQQCIDWLLPDKKKKKNE